MANRRGESESTVIFSFLRFPKSLQMVTATMKLKHSCSFWKESYDKPRQCIKKQRHHFLDKGPYRQSYGFSSSHVRGWELDCKEGWVSNNWCFWTAVLEKTLESPLDCREVKPVHPKGNKLSICWKSWSWISNTLATQWEDPIHWKRPWCWERLRARREQQSMRWLIVSLTQFTWLWTNSGR